MNEVTDSVPVVPDDVPHYAIAIIDIEDPECNKFLAERSCEVCGGQLLRCGPPCPACVESERRMMQAICEVLPQIIRDQDRMIHVHGVGWIDPWERGNERYVDP